MSRAKTKLAQDLKQGEYILTPSSGYEQISSITKVDNRVHVYAMCQMTFNYGETVEVL